jgi:hypothetical protein
MRPTSLLLPLAFRSTCSRCLQITPTTIVIGLTFNQRMRLLSPVRPAIWSGTQPLSSDASGFIGARPSDWTGSASAQVFLRPSGLSQADFRRAADGNCRMPRS